MNIDASGLVSRYHFDDGFTYCQIRQWSEMGYDSYDQWRGFNNSEALPATWQGPVESGDHKLELRSEILWHFYNEIKRSTRNLISKQNQDGFYSYFTKSNTAYCDSFGWDSGYADPVLGRNPGAGPIVMNYILTGGSTVRLFKPWVEGSKYQAVCSFDLSNPGEYLASNSDSHWWLWHQAVETTRIPDPLRPGKYLERIEPFPRTESIGSMYLYVPFFSWGKSYRLILSSQLRKLSASEIHPAFALKNWAGISSRKFQLTERVAL